MEGKAKGSDYNTAFKLLANIKWAIGSSATLGLVVSGSNRKTLSLHAGYKGNSCFLMHCLLIGIAKD